MRSRKLAWSEKAVQLLEEIRERIARDDPKAAVRFVRRLKSFVSQLRDFPYLGPALEEQKDDNLRERVFGNYRIIYRVKEKTVEVLSVFHGARLLRDDDLKGD